MNRGIMWSSGGFSMNTAMSEKHIAEAISAFGDVLIDMRPAIEHVAPQLMD